MTSPATVVPQPAVSAYATAHATPTERIELAPTLGDGKNGDIVVALIAVQDRKRTKQWLTRFEFGPATGKERADNPPRTFTATISGHTYEYSTGVPVALQIATTGPFVVGEKVPSESRQARTLISPALLGLGIDQACAALVKFEVDQKAKADTPGEAKPATLPEPAERALAGLLPAMIEFLMAAQKTPGLREILMEVLEKPSLWSIAKRRGIEPSFNFDGVAAADAAEWGLAGLGCYRLTMSLTLNGQPALRCAFFVTSPRPPLLTTAGVIGIVAESPTVAGKRVDIRVLATRRGPG